MPYQVFALPASCFYFTRILSSPCCLHQVFTLPASCLRPAARIMSTPCPHQVFALPASCLRSARIKSSPFPHHVFVLLPASCLRFVPTKMFSNPTHITSPMSNSLDFPELTTKCCWNGQIKANVRRTRYVMRMEEARASFETCAENFEGKTLSERPTLRFEDNI